jgi:hypothetical protein
VFCSEFHIEFLWGESMLNHCCRNIEKRRTGGPYHCHSSVRESFFSGVTKMKSM